MQESKQTKPSPTKKLRPLAGVIFFSRRLQQPFFLGLILAQCVYVFHVWEKLSDLIGADMGNASSLHRILDAIAVPNLSADTKELIVRPMKLTEATIMLVVLGLIEVVMISNLLMMVIIGGYETFVSRLGLHGSPDRKVKSAMVIIGASSISLLKSFINTKIYNAQIWQHEHASI